MEGGMVAVDRWSEGSQAYFPTHLHADHASGLSSSWNKDPLFCSRTTTKLHPFQLPDFDVSLFRAADVGSCYSLSLHSPSTGSPSLVQFMSIDALHCPGKAYRSTIYSELRCLKLYMLSNDMCEVVFDLIAQPTCFVMFLFRGDFGHVLYTGDFRWEAADDKAQKGRTMLLDALNGASVDVLHLDNTYCNPLYSIPSRDDATQQVMDIITSHPNYDIIIGINNLGKEQLLTHISCTLKIKAFVDAKKF